MKENEAVGFLEYVQSHLKEYGDISKNLLVKAIEFYSTPFSVDLIEKCFEGKITHNDLAKKGFCFTGDRRINFDFTVKTMYVDIHNEWIPYPLILDQFITDCIRAGIHLTFSPYSLNNLK